MKAYEYIYRLSLNIHEHTSIENQSQNKIFITDSVNKFTKTISPYDFVFIIDNCNKLSLYKNRAYDFREINTITFILR